MGIGSASYVWARRYSERQSWVAHTYQVMAELNAMSASLSSATAARRGYVMSGDRSMLANLDADTQATTEHLNHLRLLAEDNPRQQERIAQLGPAIDDKMKNMRQSVALQDSQPGAAAEQAELTNRNVVLDSEISPLLKAIGDEEQQLLNGRIAVSARTQRRFVVILVMTYLLAGLILGALFFVMTSEVTRRTEAEALAKENAERFRILVSGIQDYAIIRLDPDGNISTWNRGAERMFGYSDSEIIGQPLHYLFQECERDTPARHLTTARNSGHIQDDCQQVQKNGTLFWVTADLTLLTDSSGQPSGYALITRDITERRRQQREIEQRDAQLNAFFSNAPVGLAIIDKDLRFQRINGQFSKLNGLSPEENHGLHVREVTSDLGLELESLIQQVAATGIPVLNHEIKGHAPANPGTMGWWLKSFFPITKDDGAVTQIGAIVQDVTAQKRAENTVRWLSGRLLQSRDDERRRLARDLHDSLGQILTAVKMNLSYLGRDTSHLDERGRNAMTESKELVDACIKEVRTLSHLLHPPMLDEVGLLPAIRWFVNGFSQRSGIQVKLDLPLTLRRLPIELEIAVFRAVQESLTNVHRHSGSTTATVKLDASNGEIQLMVADDGCGIPPQKLAARPEQSLIGIGILGMRERMRQLGGQLEISSASNGTTVHVKLPVKEAA
jgi:PAS domain S-box-containing protein